jgi:hypothetical protein
LLRQNTPYNLSTSDASLTAENVQSKFHSPNHSLPLSRQSARLSGNFIRSRPSASKLPPCLLFVQRSRVQPVFEVRLFLVLTISRKVKHFWSAICPSQMHRPGNQKAGPPDRNDAFQSREDSNLAPPLCCACSFHFYSRKRRLLMKPPEQIENGQ